MKRFFSITGLTAAAVIALAGSASAADMPVKALPPPPPPLTWNGFYIGSETGWGWSKATWTSDFNCAVGALCDSISRNMDGWVAGVQGGYRWQFNSFVVGIEASIAAADIKGTQSGQACTTGVGGCPAFGNTPSYQTRVSGQGTATLQGGYTFDKSLVYVKGGWAGANVVRNDTAFIGATKFTTGDLSQHVTNGYTVGVGWEYALTQNVSFAVEYDYLHLPVTALTTNAILGAFSTTQTAVTLNVHEVMFRTNYRFGWPH